jgi:hypothetical protein
VQFVVARADVMNTPLQQADSSTGFGAAMHDPSACPRENPRKVAPECGMPDTLDAVTGADQQKALFRAGISLEASVGI